MTGRSVSLGARSALLMPSTSGFPLRFTCSRIQVVASPTSTRPPGPVPDSTSMRTVSTSERAPSAVSTIRALRAPLARCSPGVSKNAICIPGAVWTPRMRVRVVCGLGETMATFSPSTRLRRVDLPTLGRPTMATKPARSFAGSGVFFLPTLGSLAARDGDLLQLHLGVACAGDLGHQVEALHHLADDGVVAVQVRRRHLGDEELRAVGVGAGG